MIRYIVAKDSCNTPTKSIMMSYKHLGAKCACLINDGQTDDIIDSTIPLLQYDIMTIDETKVMQCQKFCPYFIISALNSKSIFAFS